jgi:arsenate reductase (thioredoxin)
MSASEFIVIVIFCVGYVVFVRFLWREELGMPWIDRFESRRQRVREPNSHVLFVCTHNSARSQMAEALLRHVAGDQFYVASAGATPTTVHPLAEQVMAERGVTLRGHRAKQISEMGTRWEYVITLCEAAYEVCPDYPPKTSRLHWSIEDPSRILGNSSEEIAAFRRVRDELTERIRQWLSERIEQP